MRSVLFSTAGFLALCGGAMAQDISFTIKLTTPLSTSTSHKGDPVSGQVVQPANFAGDLMQGHVTEVKTGNKLRGDAVLNFNFDMLQHGGASLPVASSVTSIANSKGQVDVDEEGRAIRKSSNVGKAALGTGAGALIGGLAGGLKGAAIGAGTGAAASIVAIEIAASGPKVELAAGSQIGLSVKSRSGPDLNGLQPNGGGVAPPPVVSSNNPPSPGPVTPPLAGAASATTGGQPNFTTVRIDFVPGERTVFYDDFSDMAQDEPPPHWRLRENPVELRVAGSVRELYAASNTTLTSGHIAVPPDFTFELSWTGQGETKWIFRDKDSNEVMSFVVRGEPDGTSANMSVAVAGPNGGELGSGGIRTNLTQPVEFALWSQRGRVRAYMNGQRLLDVNQVSLMAPPDTLEAHIGGYRPNGIREVRIAESAPDFSAMIGSSGKYVTHGIFFDTDSAQLKPESAPVLKMVAQGLERNPNLKLEIDGYTDSVGDAAHNVDLSRRRSEAVKSVLISQFGIDAGRLTSSGFGADRPVASNDTPDGRAQNRRVEFIRQ